MPASEAFQLATGLAIPLLLIPHAAGIRLGYAIQGMEFGYARLLYQFWVVSPDFALPRQILLLVTIWIHGCIGLRSWFRTMRWYPRAVPALASLATLVPVLAMALASWAVPNWPCCANVAVDRVQAAADIAPIMSLRIIGPLHGWFGHRE